MAGAVYFHFFSTAEVVSGCQVKVVGWEKINAEGDML